MIRQTLRSGGLSGETFLVCKGSKDWAPALDAGTVGDGYGSCRKIVAAAWQPCCILPVMANIDRHEPGSFCWIELATTDPNAAKAFYASLFGWKSNDFPM